MQKPTEIESGRAEKKFLQLYKVVTEREKFLNNEARIMQYSAVLRYFTKFLQGREEYTSDIAEVLYQVYAKLGDIYYEEALQNQDNSKYFLATEYFNQALTYAGNMAEKNYVLLILKDLYFYLNDEDAYVRVEDMWADSHNKEDKFAAYMLLAQNADVSHIKAQFLEKALDEVMAQKESVYEKYQDTLYICSQLAAIYEIQGEKDKAVRVKKLRENTLKLLN